METDIDVMAKRCIEIFEILIETDRDRARLMALCLMAELDPNALTPAAQIELARYAEALIAAGHDVLKDR